jgi:hypothetical protein
LGAVVVAAGVVADDLAGVGVAVAPVPGFLGAEVPAEPVAVGEASAPDGVVVPVLLVVPSPEARAGTLKPPAPAVDVR